MTPLWKACARWVGSNYNSVQTPDLWRRFLNVQRTFDLSQVTDLCESTWRELFRGNDGSDIYDLGERVVFPFEHIWLEFADGGFGYLVETCEHKESGLFMISKLMHDKNARKIFLEPKALVENGEELFWVKICDTVPEEDLVQAYTDAGWVLSALAVLASPSAVSDTSSSRKALGGKYPKATRKDIVATTITLNIAGRRTAGVSRATTSPKAYHFVRAHAREIAEGRIVKVRAHWRGDPAFGIRVASYKVVNETAVPEASPLGTVH